MRAAGIAADVVAAWHGHTERMTQAVSGRVTNDRLTAMSAVFSAAAGQSLGQLACRMTSTANKEPALIHCSRRVFCRWS